MSDAFIANSEIIYRCVWANEEGKAERYRIKTDRTIQILSPAFLARESNGEFRISVDRAMLCNNNPKHTLGAKLGIVVSLVVEKVRNIDDPKLQRFKIDVEPVPLLSNVAHAEIYGVPRFESVDGTPAFRKLCQRLARLALIECVQISSSE
jgi:hypothetical protein